MATAGLGSLALVLVCGLAWSGVDLFRKLLAGRLQTVPLVALLTLCQLPLLGAWLATAGGLRLQPGYWLPAERSIERAVDAGQPVVALRPHIVVGPGLDGLFATLFAGLRSGKMRLATSLRWPHYMVHVDALVAAWRSALAWPGSAFFNLGCGPTHSIRDLMEGLIEERGLRATIRQTPRVWYLLRRHFEHWTGRCWLGPCELALLRRGLVFDCAAAAQALGWRPHWSAGEMVRETYELSPRAGGR